MNFRKLICVFICTPNIFKIIAKSEGSHLLGFHGKRSRYHQAKKTTLGVSKLQANTFPNQLNSQNSPKTNKEVAER